METFAYLHVACAYEAPEVSELTLDVSSWKRLSGQVGLRVMTIALPLTILAMAGSAMALQVGDRSSEVRALQNDLKTLGYFDQQATGYYGPVTQNAVEKFQADYGLTIDGEAGPATLQALRDRLSGGSEQPVSSSGYLQLGSSGSEVSDLQQQLSDLGYGITVDGEFGPATDRAVRRFQSSYGLQEDGVVGPDTRSLLTQVAAGNNFEQPVSDSGSTDSDYGSSYADRTLRFGDRGEDVRRLQEQLRDRGYYRGPIDGEFETGTENAVKSFQSAKGLYPDGVVGTRTLAALGEGRPTANKRYVVVIPTDRTQLYRVTPYAPRARFFTAPIGPHIRADSFTTYRAAERLTKTLRSRGLDAQVRYF